MSYLMENICRVAKSPLLYFSLRINLKLCARSDFIDRVCKQCNRIEEILFTV